MAVGYSNPLVVPFGLGVPNTPAPATVGFTSLFWWMGGVGTAVVPPAATVGFISLFWWMGGVGGTVAPPVSGGTSAGTYNMYRPWDWGKKRKLRKVKYLGPANEKLTFYVESTPENRWIPTTIYKPSVLEEIERNGLIVRQINAAKLRRIIMADDEWLMLN